MPGQQGAPKAMASAVPGPDEDREVMHAAFMSAYGQSHHGPRIKGMQEFAGAVSGTAGMRQGWGGSSAGCHRGDRWHAASVMHACALCQPARIGIS